MPSSSSASSSAAPWLGLVVGNTRLHWGLFYQQQWQAVWHTPHLTAPQVAALIDQQFDLAAWRSLQLLDQDTLDELAPLTAIATSPSPLRLYGASVVPAQTALWQSYSGFREVTLADIPLANLYPSLGIDRALNLLGAGDRYGWPILVIDAGTALTFTAGTAERFIGGAILPGLTTQFATLAANTANLPTAHLPTALPSRWASNTAAAIHSGVIYGTLATLTDYLQAWQQEYPTGYVVLTGGDGSRLYQWWQQHHQKTPGMAVEPHLTFFGLSRLQPALLATDPQF
ncbi:pantothenate kinase [Leptolyngbya iicbica]|uniref:Type III pantothenate kinase n=2 Tax=Cyanophyceae TaxID=3028117 RepID=A0A4Q7EG46_9CYAN|nr:pantothenate kinase [Leptolyngbya sp. LK]RZM82232.1 pantothenate kinase [Leptolyngbya sp. LK]